MKIVSWRRPRPSIDLCLNQRRDPVASRQLAPLIGVHDRGQAISGHGCLQRRNTETGMQRSAELPAQHLPRGSVHDGHEIQAAALDGHDESGGTPDLVEAVYDHVPQQVERNGMLRMWQTGSGALAHSPCIRRRPV